MTYLVVFFFQAEDGIRDLVRSRGLGDVYKRQHHAEPRPRHMQEHDFDGGALLVVVRRADDAINALSLIHI